MYNTKSTLVYIYISQDLYGKGIVPYLLPKRF